MKHRTTQQNSALHLWFQKLSDSLNEAGCDVRKVLKEDVSLDWTPALIKEILWRSVQKAMHDKQSTADLTSEELQLTWDVLNRHIGERFGIHVPFPSLEELVEEDKRTRSYKYPENDKGEPKF